MPFLPHSPRRGAPVSVGIPARRTGVACGGRDASAESVADVAAQRTIGATIGGMRRSAVGRSQIVAGACTSKRMGRRPGWVVVSPAETPR